MTDDFDRVIDSLEQMNPLREPTLRSAIPTLQLPPGHAMLEARLNATCSAYAPFLREQPPLAHFQRMLHWFPKAGIIEATCTTLIGQVQAPLEPEIRAALALLFEMLWGGASDQASQVDIEQYHRLCSQGSPDFIPDIPEYCDFFTYTMFTGVVAFT